LVAGKTSLSSKSWTKTDGQNLLQKFVQESSGAHIPAPQRVAAALHLLR
jgi:hypothetical protein